jgi:monoamine oxidase
MNREFASSQTRTLIIGGGLSGLWAARLLQDHKEHYALVEARPQLGGRIRTTFRDDLPIELGPSWFWPQTQPRITRLVEGMFETHPQYTSGDAILEEAGTLRRTEHTNVDPRLPRRLARGSTQLTAHLQSCLPPERLFPAHVATSIVQTPGHLSTTTSSPDGPRRFESEAVILALPPRQISARIEFTPGLGAGAEQALRQVPTWMAGDAKFFALYDAPFWRDRELSGSAFSDAGPLGEVHDASLPGGQAALLGFLLPDRAAREQLGGQLIPSCLDQLARYFGPAALTPSDTLLHDWSTEEFIATSEDAPLEGHPEYGSRIAIDERWRGRLHFAGTETAPQHGGYMEGALEAAERAVQAVL